MERWHDQLSNTSQDFYSPSHPGSPPQSIRNDSEDPTHLLWGSSSPSHSFPTPSPVQLSNSQSTLSALSIYCPEPSASSTHRTSESISQQQQPPSTPSLLNTRAFPNSSAFPPPFSPPSSTLPSSPPPSSSYPPPPISGTSMIPNTPSVSPNGSSANSSHFTAFSRPLPPSSLASHSSSSPFDVSAAVFHTSSSLPESSTSNPAQQFGSFHLPTIPSATPPSSSVPSFVPSSASQPSADHPPKSSLPTVSAKRHKRAHDGAALSTTCKSASRIYALELLFSCELPPNRPHFIPPESWRELLDQQAAHNLISVTLVVSPPAYSEDFRPYITVSLPEAYDVYIHSRVNYGPSLTDSTPNHKTRFRWWSDSELYQLHPIKNHYRNPVKPVVERSICLPVSLLLHPYFSFLLHHQKVELFKELSAFFGRWLLLYIDREDHAQLITEGFGRTRKKPRTRSEALSSFDTVTREFVERWTNLCSTQRPS